MKKIKRILFIAALVLSGSLFSGCSDFLDEKAYDFIGPEQIGDSDAGADMWVMGTYSKLCDDMFRWDELPRILDQDCDYVTGPDWSFAAMGAGSFQEESAINRLWIGSYALINRANVAIGYIKGMKNVSEAHKNNNLGELYFLKAWCYFWLVRGYGDVPIYEDAVSNGAAFSQPRQPIAKVYEHIIKLLTDAEGMMYKNTDAAFTSGRASAGAAASLLAKVYVTIASAATPSANITFKGGPAYTLNGKEIVRTKPVTLVAKKTAAVAGYEGFNSQDYFKLAMDKAAEVMKGTYGTYDLIPNFRDVWSIANRNKTEHIWSLQAKSGDQLYGNGVSRWYTGVDNSSKLIIEGMFMGCRDHWYQLFDDSKDSRVIDGVNHKYRFVDQQQFNAGCYYPASWKERAEGVKRDSLDKDGNQVKDASGNVIQVFVKKPEAQYNDGVAWTFANNSRGLAFTTKYADVSDRTINKGDIHYPFLRFADILLIYAEASNEVAGPNQAAIEALNRVRNRSHATPFKLTGTGALLDKETFRSAVIEERAMELALEGDRRWDLLRWGIYLDVMNSIGGLDECKVNKSRSAKHLLFPIPTSEILTNPKITTNNPGWN
ncbi:RagB/SusD family nutrient uptake outer membrane protein [uncultured Acetobacteroides sp.]|uniref:RagB/SusD family nutrient uptake outer membrane protein n=1 Tax=uncultured Acetobacteroides sp. TaxID=1760811 RepID=UPI0029F4C652|nr:RagB/SusD family nutrient uptake outer membrane protein [uncultured Acetobacteroides sp.]